MTKATLSDRRPLGGTALEVSRLALGTGAIGLDPQAVAGDRAEAVAIDAIRAAIELGINYVDTSPSYQRGTADRRVGLALAGGRRDKVVLASKVGTHPDRTGDYTAAAALWTVDQCRRALGTDVIDVVLIHDPASMDQVLAPGGLLEGLETLHRSGAIRAIGIGVQSHQYLRRALQSGRFHVIQSPYDYNLLRTTALPIFEQAALQGVGVINASPFHQGLLAGPDPAEIVKIRAATAMWSPRARDVQAAREIWCRAQSTGIDLRAAALQFCLAEPRVTTTLIGPRSAQEIEEDVESAFHPIPEPRFQRFRGSLADIPGPAPGGEAAIGPYPPD